MGCTKQMGVLCHSSMDKIVGVSIFNQHNYFVVLDIANQFQGLAAEKPNRAWREIWGSSQRD
jgi:hypothetical protein